MKFGNIEIISECRAMKEVFRTINLISKIDVPVLIKGETGTGKELIAQAIHFLSEKSTIRTLNCSAIPKDLIESELFGHEKGSFTGADKNRKGAFRSADGGTLFLDEIGDMSLEAQAKLLRALENGEVTPVGSDSSYMVDCRVIAATNQNLKEKMKKGEFRSDLYYRLKTIEVNLPPLRERGEEDLKLLVYYFWDYFWRKHFSQSKVDPRVLLADFFCQLILDVEDLESIEEVRKKAENYFRGFSFDGNMSLNLIKKQIFFFYYGMKEKDYKGIFWQLLKKGFLAYTWPGNIRELSSYIESSLLLRNIQSLKEEKEETKKRRISKKELKKKIKELIINKYNGRVVLSFNDPEVREFFNVDNQGMLQSLIHRMGLSEQAKDARKKYISSFSDEELKEVYKEVGGNRRDFAERFFLSPIELKEFLGDRLEKLDE